MTSVAAEKILGIVFILAVALKAWDLEAFAFQIRYYHVLEDRGLLWVAVGAVAWETLLGVALVVGLRLKGWTCEVCHAEKGARRRASPRDCVPECRGVLCGRPSG
ncbi:MAG: MauE/DoxX family redox-associated membrane protein [Candidatus Hydrogenedentales bacterium]